MESYQNAAQRNRLGQLLHSKKAFILLEIVAVFFVAISIIYLLKPMAADDLLLQQGIVWIANVVALTLVWLGLRLRGQNIDDLGLSMKFRGWKSFFRLIGHSIIVFLFAISFFILASIIMANLVGIPESSDMSGYSYIHGNVGMLILSLIGVYIVSSLGEEVIYRAFLINRISQLFKSGRTVISIILSSIIFGLAHYEWGIVGVVQTSFMGLGLAISYVRFKRNLWVTVVAHVYMDTILMVQLYLA